MPVQLQMRLDLLKADLGVVRSEFDVRSAEILRGAAKVMLDTAVDATPVDTGEAVSNWRVGAGQPTRVKVPPFYPGIKGSTGDANKAAAKAAGAAKIARTKPGQEIFISNHADHAPFLENGSPTTVASHMTDRALLAGESYVARQKVLP